MFTMWWAATPKGGGQRLPSQRRIRCNEWLKWDGKSFIVLHSLVCTKCDNSSCVKNETRMLERTSNPAYFPLDTPGDLWTENFLPMVSHYFAGLQCTKKCSNPSTKPRKKKTVGKDGNSAGFQMFKTQVLQMFYEEVTGFNIFAFCFWMNNILTIRPALLCDVAGCLAPLRWQQDF